ncbi:alpha/beta fold hydrolase [Lachnospiraceae bacterium LCP25S3_G4]
MKTDFYYPSQDGTTQIHAVEWMPDGDVKAILQISHGMVEYINRYDAFGSYLAERGYYVVGQDHLGHGESVQTEADHGFFHEKHGNDYVIGDIHELRRRTTAKYPTLPYYMLGHSMGSFLTRQYIKKYGEGLHGVIIMGTGEQPPMIVSIGKILCTFIAHFKGWHYRSTFINNIAFGGYNKKFQPSRTTVDWLCKDTSIVDAYLEDPWCTFIFTVNAYYHMFCGMQELSDPANLERIPKDLPIFFVAGKEDPVGNFGKSVKKVYQKYKTCGMKDVSIKLYDDDRHEILNETDKFQVFADLYAWLDHHLPR